MYRYTTKIKAVIQRTLSEQSESKWTKNPPCTSPAHTVPAFRCTKIRADGLLLSLCFVKPTASAVGGRAGCPIHRSAGVPGERICSLGRLAMSGTSTRSVDRLCIFVCHSEAQRAESAFALLKGTASAVPQPFARQAASAPEVRRFHGMDFSPSHRREQGPSGP